MLGTISQNPSVSKSDCLHVVIFRVFIIDFTAWEYVIKQIKINHFFVAAMLQGFDQTWGVGNVFCRRNNLHIAWNWQQQHS